MRTALHHFKSEERFSYPNSKREGLLDMYRNFKWLDLERESATARWRAGQSLSGGAGADPLRHKGTVWGRRGLIEVALQQGAALDGICI